jgi:NAD(P)-dependent dehydrogenase (short-subunit alcohol dehydrogenase family)
MTDNAKPLTGYVAVVLGATRASGRGIAIELGCAGATVYCTGRSVRGGPASQEGPETIEETAEMVQAHGGMAVPIKLDHTDASQVSRLFERIAVEQNGRLDVLVNVGASGGSLKEFAAWGYGLPMWECDTDGGLSLFRGITAHILTARYGLPLMTARNSGLLVEVTDGTSYGYRGQNHGMFYYSLQKINFLHIAEAIAMDLKHKGLHGVTAVALTPGFLRSEAILRKDELTEERWQEKRRQEEIDNGLPLLSDPSCESTRYIGRAVVALATDSNAHAKSGQALSTGQLMKEYGFTDIDGRQPFWDWTAS